MRKKILIITIILIFISLFSLNSYANSYEEIWDNLDDQTEEYLADIGIDEISFNELFEVTPTRIIKFILELAFEKGTYILPKIIRIIIVIVILAICLSFLKESNKLTDIIKNIGLLVILSFIIEPISRMLTDTVTGIKLSTVFINSYLPVMTSIIVASKKPTMALTYNSFSIFLSSIISNIADKIMIPLLGGMLSFSIISSISYEQYQEKILKTIRKFIVIILSLFSTIFTGLLTTQSILSYSSDSLLIKGIKFASGTFVPIVGSGVGDAISSIFSSFIIMKNTLGVFIIIVILLINLPIIIELLLWYFILGFCSVFSSFLGIDSVTDIFESLSSILSLMNIIMFFITFVLVISTGIIIVMGK